MGGITESFSYTFKEMDLIKHAKDIAKRNNQSFSKLVVAAISEYIDEQKKVDPPSYPIRGAINLCHNEARSSKDNMQYSLLNYLEKSPIELSQEIHEIEDIPKIRTVIHRSNLIQSVAKTRLRNLQKW